MGIISPTIPTVGQPRGAEEVDVRSALITIRDEINGLLDSDNLATNAVGTAEIQNGAVTLAKIASGVVPTMTRGSTTVPSVSNTSVTHGLGTTPTAVVLGPGASNDFHVTAVGATTFTLHNDGSSATCYWAAIA